MADTLIITLWVSISSKLRLSFFLGDLKRNVCMLNRIGPYLLSSIIRVFSWLSLQRAQTTGAWLGRLIWRVNAQPAQINRENLARCFPQLDEPERAHLSRSSLEETCKFGTESGMITYWDRPRWLTLVKQVSGWDRIEQATRAGRGVLVLAPHFGNWELFNLYLGSRVDLTVLYKPPKLSALNTMFKTVRARSGSTLVETDAAGIRVFYRALREGKAAGLLPDQVPDPEAGIIAPFFGQPALTMTFAHRLIRATNPLVVFCYAHRLPDAGGYDIGINAAPEGVYDTDPLVCATAINEAVEKIVRIDPAQYQWEYKRFKLPRERRS